METRALILLTRFARIADNIETSLKWRIGDRLCARYERSRLRRKDFSIICDDCIVLGIYHKFGLQYTTPTLGLFFYPEDYINFLEKFEYLIRQPLRFTDTSRHTEANKLRKTMHYPIGILGENVEIQFLHYKDKKEAADKWERRTRRINFKNLFFIYSGGEQALKEGFLARYQKLPFVHKIFLVFSSSPSPIWNSECVVLVRGYEDKPLGYSVRNRKYEKYIDLVRWLNGERDFLKKK